MSYFTAIPRGIGASPLRGRRFATQEEAERWAQTAADFFGDGYSVFQVWSKKDRRIVKDVESARAAPGGERTPP